MQSLLQDRLVNRITPHGFVTTVTESFYISLDQKALREVFPPNCHRNAAVNSLSIETSDYQYMLSGCGDSSIKLWDLKDQTMCDEQNEGDDVGWQDVSKKPDLYDYDNPVSTFRNLVTVPAKSVHQYGISSIQWWPYDTGMFVSASFDHTVKVWDTNEMNAVHTFDMESRVYATDISCSVQNSFSSQALVAVGADSPFIRLLDLRSTSSAHTLKGHKGKTLCVKWHPQFPHLLASGGFDGEVKVWDIRRSDSCISRLDMLHTTGTTSITDNLTRASVKAHSAPVNGLAWDELGHTLFTAGNDDKVRVWDMVSNVAPPINKLINFGPLTRNKYPQTIPMVLSPKYESEIQHLIFPSDNSDLFIFRTIDGKLVSRLSRKGSKKQGRTSSIVNCGPFSCTYYCGTIDGEIIAWAPRWDQPNVDDIFEPDYNSKISPENVENVDSLLHDQAERIITSDPYFK